MQINRVLLTAVGSVLLAMVTIQSGASLAKQLFPLVGPEGTTKGKSCYRTLVGVSPMASITTRPRLAEHYYLWPMFRRDEYPILLSH